MRSYYEHLQNLIPSQKTHHLTKSIFRSSAIFPVFHSSQIKSRLLFMGYWILKRHIKEIGAVVNLRSDEGELLQRSFFSVNQPKTYRIDLEDELQKALDKIPPSFQGSLEIEFYSSQNLTFPFPAVVINYYSTHFSTVVHTAQRIYNDWEDMNSNSQTSVPEAGFNLYADENHEPLIALINGPELNKQCLIEMTFFNHNQEQKKEVFHFENLQPYQTLVIHPSQHVDLNSFFDHRPGSAKVKFQLNWVYPRLIAGNMNKQSEMMSITHTYYDCSEATNEKDYWTTPPPGHHGASLMIPAQLDELHFTKIYFYPIYSPAAFNIALEIYDREGRLLGQVPEALKVSLNCPGFQSIDLKKRALELKIDLTQPLGVKVIAEPLEGTVLPARIKLGLDLGLNNALLPCNICTNLQPYNPSLDQKRQSFKWGPILADQPRSKVYIMNSSPEINYHHYSTILVNFYREKDTETYQKTYTLPAHGFILLSPELDEELKRFLENKVGWFTALCDNPYTTTYYFSEHPSGSLGGDHGF